MRDGYDLVDELAKPFLRFSAVNALFAIPLKAHFTSVQGLAVEDEALALFVGEAAFYQGEIEGFIAAIDFIAHDGVAHVREVDADLVFATGQQLHFEQGEVALCAGETLQYFVCCLGRCAIRSHAIFDGYDTALIFAQGGVDDAAIRCHMAADDGLVDFADFAAFPLAAELLGGGIGLGDEHQSTGLAVEAVDEVRVDAFTQMDTHPADEAGVDVAFGGVADEVGRLVDDKEFVVFVDDFKEVIWGRGGHIAASAPASVSCSKERVSVEHGRGFLRLEIERRLDLFMDITFPLTPALSLGERE